MMIFRNIILFFVISLLLSACQHVEIWTVDRFQTAVLQDKDTNHLHWYYVGSDENFDYFRKLSNGQLINEIRVDITQLPLPQRRMYSTDSRDWNELYPKK